MRKLDGLIKTNTETNRLTKESIQQALIYLLPKYDLDDIKVQEIVYKAGVSRSAFYKNYKTKLDVLNDFLNTLLNTFNSSNINYLEINPNIYFNNLLNYLKKNEEIAVLIKNLNQIHLIRLNLQWDFKNLKIDDYEYLALASSINTLLITWIRNDYNKNLDDIVNILMKLFTNFS